MQNKISIFCIKEAGNIFLAIISLYRIKKKKKCKSHQLPKSTYNAYFYCVKLGIGRTMAGIVIVNFLIKHYTLHTI